MNLKIIIPSKTIFSQDADKISAPGKEGFFQILPKHIDFVSSLQPGILTVFSGDIVNYFAINQGFLVKKGDVVYISCLQAIKGETLETLSKTVADSFRQLDEKERRTNEILVKLEADMLRMIIENE
ncbi:hypothetical protein [Anaerobium acetethylicum]|uniref:F-type H+-transporting ATPase subunit epsilon n=1 Tax=Anaerobium acetethylicum TaxID=1619234 RepID=A0A1D3TR63_9FIRM|nr:hypothetical protein [Anaerobium acetethylicum]SCP96137.1 F-type H+-transporting ATPase subunit epsilon [Anaerobium acetethylicum]